ncbi:EamA family transporter RarD [Pacificibacter marinus]|uniref:EamA family transporter RarD n=1 Tax=Pacificibacter marinus TaxID=658057 RepID=UPI001C072F19|nr:EamA family transporter RarD [Pacificibacter marinus]MBU2866356.1 EamA family transporter RarD [Pacificibacter marinus]
MTDRKTGFLALFLAYTLWGISALYYREVNHVPGLEVLAHRTFWSFVMFGAIIALQGRTRELLFLLHPKSGAQGLYRIAPAAILVSLNWFLFIYAIQSDQTLEASLAYYIFPLMAAGVGVMIFGERLKGLQYISMLLGLAAVVVLTIGLGAAPWLALTMSGSFVIYGTIKKGLAVGAVISMAAEAALLAPFALIYLIGVEIWGWGGTETQASGVFGATIRDTVLLILAGAVTGVPLILFSIASRRMSMIVLGLGNYHNSTLQMIIAVWVFGQVITPSHMIALPMIWTGLALFTWTAWRADRQARTDKISAVSSSTEETVL